jgi:UrcA family protein
MDGRKVASLAAAGLIGALLVAAAVTPVHGQNAGRPVTVEAQNPLARVVSFGDLALNTKPGRTILMRRVSVAVDEVCPDFDEHGSTYAVQSCKDFAWTGARPQIKRALAQARSGSTIAMSIEVMAASDR